MPFFDKYPYTNFHNVNLDWILERVKEWGELVKQNNIAFHNLEEANEAFKEYVTNYLQNLDIQAQIDDKLDRMFESGELTDYLQPYVSDTVTEWLDENISEPSGIVIDSSLTVSGAAADAKAAGNKITDVNNTILYLSSALTNTVKNAILNCFEHVALWTDENASEHIETLRSVFFNQSNITSIDVVTNITIPIYSVDNINILRNYITVTAHYSDYTSRILTSSEYILLGKLESGTQKIIVFYDGLTTDFTITVNALILATMSNVLYNNGITNLECTNGTFTTGTRVSFSAFTFNTNITKCYFLPNKSGNAEWIVFRYENNGNTLYGFNGSGVSKFEWDGTHYTATGVTPEFIIKRGANVNDTGNKNVTLLNDTIRIESLSGYVEINRANIIGFWMSQGSWYIPTNCLVNEVAQ